MSESRGGESRTSYSYTPSYSKNGESRGTGESRSTMPTMTSRRI